MALVFITSEMNQKTGFSMCFLTNTWLLFALWSLLVSITKANEERGTIEIIEAISSSSSEQANNNTKTFSFDAVFSSNSSQKVVYDVCAAPIVQSVLQGYNGTIFCYGQTGAGKVCQPNITPFFQS
jgi:hypothetical protein